LHQALRDAADGRMVGRLSASDAISSQQRRRNLAATARSGPWVILEYFDRDFDRFEKQYMDFIDSLTMRSGPE
jgi:hypothetical protein